MQGPTCEGPELALGFSVTGESIYYNRLVRGHTREGPELALGFSVTGEYISLQ